MTQKYKIIALFGPAGSGKDYILKALMDTKWSKNNLHRIVSYTTRPPRENEKNGINYHFVSTYSEISSKPLIEYTIFKNWWYATSLNDLNFNKINIGIFNVSSIDQLVNRDFQNQLDCIPIYIESSPKKRLIRQLLRESNPDCDEIIRRYLSDKETFLNIPFSFHTVKNELNKTDIVIEDIFNIIQNEWGKKDKIK